MAKRINWMASKSDLDKITKIVVRAASLMSLESRGVDRLTCSMDITACHLNGCPLDLNGLLAAEDFDFVHDVGGIIHHIDRTTGKLRNCFDPRYSQKVATA